MADKITYAQLLDRLGLPSSGSLGWEEVKEKLWTVGSPLGDLIESMTGGPAGISFESAWFIREPRSLVYLASDPSDGEFAIVDAEIKPFVAAIEELRARSNRIPSPKMLKSIVNVDPDRRPKPVEPGLSDLAALSQVELDVSKLTARGNGDLKVGKVTVEQVARAVASAMRPPAPGWGFGRPEIDMTTGKRIPGRVACAFAYAPWRYEEGEFVADVVTVGVKQGITDDDAIGSPDRAWSELAPWMDPTTARFEEWANTNADDRIQIPFALAKAWVKDKLPDVKIPE